jgi:nucleoside-diphosphate-sugar epimerase
MRIFVAGASGVIGVRLLPLLVERGHRVAGMTRTPSKASTLRALGAEPVICDVYDADELVGAVVAFAPDLVMHQLTDLPDDAALIAGHAEANARIRREGTRNLLAAARAASAPRLVTQSVAWELPGEGGVSVREMERATLDAGGVVLRYGRFYGEGTYYPDSVPASPRIHVDEAARRTLDFLVASPGIVILAEEHSTA